MYSNNTFNSAYNSEAQICTIFKLSPILPYFSIVLILGMRRLWILDSVKDSINSWLTGVEIESQKDKQVKTEGQKSFGDGIGLGFELRMDRIWSCEV
jgi:hypothetical protein